MSHHNLIIEFVIRILLTKNQELEHRVKSGPINRETVIEIRLAYYQQSTL